MAIDSVSGGSDPTEQRRAQRLQEERAAQLERAESRAQDEIAHLNQNRQEQLERIYETQSSEIDSRRREAADMVEIAKADAQSRTRAFEAESSKMTEEAKRQFQSKANQLQRTSTELQKQRELLVKQHENAMQRIRDNSLNTQAVATARAEQEANMAHLNQARGIAEINERGDFEASRARDAAEAQKREATNEGAQRIRATQEEYQDQANQIDKQIAFAKREGQDQMAKERENLRSSQIALETEADDRAQRLNMKTQSALNRMHIEGQRKVMDTQNTYAHQLQDAEKDTHNKLREQQNRANFTMASLQSEADAQEGIARATYANQKQAISHARDKNIADNQKAAEALQKQLRSDFETRSRAFKQITEAKLLGQLNADEEELKFHRDEGRRQVNNQIATDAALVADHGAKAADAFYRVHSLGTQVEDGELETVVRLAVPEHEQDSVRLTHQRDSLTISGARRFQTKAMLEDGHGVTTNAFQSYTESFPVRGKLMINNMTRTYADGMLTFRIPKG